jgi:hypothetical protein
MRIVVRSALLLALMVALPSIAPAQGREDGDYSGYKAQQDEDASVVSTGSHSGQPVNWPDGWVRESDSDTPFQDVAGSQGDDGATAYQQDGDPPAAGQEYTEGTSRDGDATRTVEGEGGNDDRYSDTAQTVEGEGGSDYRYGETARTVEGEGGNDDRYSDTAQTVEGEGGSDYRYGDTTGTTDGGSDYRYGDTAGSFQDFGRNSYSGGYRSTYSGRYGASAGSGRGMNCYIDRRGRTICR